MMKFLGSMILAAGLAASVSANAATYTLNTLPGGVTSFTETVSSGNFSDVVDFTLGKQSDLGSGVGSSFVSIFGTPIFNINGLTLSVYNSNNQKLGSGVDFVLNNLTAGNYYAVISGKATGAAGGIYSGAFQVSAVPEASIWAMLLAGLGLLGYTASRRKV